MEIGGGYGFFGLNVIAIECFGSFAETPMKKLGKRALIRPIV